MENTRKAAEDFVANGGKCLKQRGFGWKGARSVPMPTGNWCFGTGYYELSWVEKDGETYLKFTEYSEADMW